MCGNQERVFLCIVKIRSIAAALEAERDNTTVSLIAMACLRSCFGPLGQQRNVVQSPAAPAASFSSLHGWQ